VTEGIESGADIEILDGLKAGEKVVTSAQFLIDSEASFKASMLRMTKSSTPAQEPAPANTTTAITGEGKVTEVNVQQHALTIAHQPIAALKWPAMTMAFAVKEGVTLEGIKAGDHVSFSLESDADAYVITQIASTSKREAKP